LQKIVRAAQRKNAAARGRRFRNVAVFVKAILLYVSS
jgi:hypothetical protein